MNPYSAVNEFEKMVAEWSGSAYAVAVESGTAAIFLSLQYVGVKGKEVSIPAFTYPSIPMAIIQAGGKVKFEGTTWNGVYELGTTGIIDGALRFRKQMYAGGLHMLSFHIKKNLPLGRGGMVLTDDKDAYDWLKKARFDGRTEGVRLDHDDFTMLGWNMYMNPPDAIRGIQLFHAQKDKELPDVDFESQTYPDLRKFPIFSQ